MSDWIDQPRAIREGEGLNEANLHKVLLDHVPQLSGDMEVHQFPGGFSNLTYSVKVGSREFVLRRPPFGAQIKSGHDMGREYKILSNLNPQFSKAPKAVYYTEDESIIGSPFYLMERVRGVILRANMPADMQPDKTQMAGIANSWLDTLVELHSVDYDAAGLSDLGKPEGYVERQVHGWTKRYYNAKTDEVPLLENAARWLSEHIPSQSGATLIHNDFKYDNVVLNPRDWTHVIAVLDWEMTTLGDPLMDLGTSIGYWVNGNDPDFMKQLDLTPTHLPGNPSRGELMNRYATKTGTDVGDGVFYYVFGLFKIAVIVQQIYYRYKKGLTKDPRFAGLLDAVQGIGNITHQAISKKQIDDLF